MRERLCWHSGLRVVPSPAVFRCKKRLVAVCILMVIGELRTVNGYGNCNSAGRGNLVIINVYAGTDGGGGVDAEWCESRGVSGAGPTEVATQ
jgi:hypothetical protein